MNTDVPWHQAGIKVTHIALIISAIDWSVPHRQGQAGTLRLEQQRQKRAPFRKQGQSHLDSQHKTSRFYI